jgi:hypothetical protein
VDTSRREVDREFSALAHRAHVDVQLREHATETWELTREEAESLRDALTLALKDASEEAARLEVVPPAPRLDRAAGAEATAPSVPLPP